MNTTHKATPSTVRYTQSFKQEVLALIAAGRTLSQVSRELGVSLSTLSEWRKIAKNQLQNTQAEAPEANSDPGLLTAEVARLRKALAKSELNAEILKKALAIVGQTTPNFSA